MSYLYFYYSLNQESKLLVYQKMKKIFKNLSEINFFQNDLTPVRIRLSGSFTPGNYFMQSGRWAKKKVLGQEISHQGEHETVQNAISKKKKIGH